MRLKPLIFNGFTIEHHYSVSQFPVFVVGVEFAVF